MPRNILTIIAALMAVYLGLVLANQIGAPLPGWLFSTSGATAKVSTSREDAVTICERFVRNSLRAPASARFSGPGDTSAVSTSTNVWRVRGWVDAQNGFGALLRNDYDCETRFNGQHWLSESLTVAPR